MRIIRIARTSPPPAFSVGDVVDVRSSGDGDVVAGTQGNFKLRLPKGIYRCTIANVDDPDRYADNVVTYVGRAGDGQLIRFTDRCGIKKALGRQNPSAIGAGKTRLAQETPKEDWPFTVEKICAYCKKLMGHEKSRYNAPTHGMCSECFKREMAAADAEEAARMPA